MQRGQGGVAIDLGEFAVGVDHLAVADHRSHASGLAALQHRVEHRRFRIQIRIRDLPPVDQHHVRGLARCQDAQPVAERRGFCSARGRHAEHLGDRRHVGVYHAGGAMGAQHHAHFLQHVTIVVDAGFIDADRGVDALGLEDVQRRDAGAQAEIRRAVVADAGAGLGDAIDVRLVQPDAVAERHLRAEQAEAVDVLKRRSAAAPARVFLLVGGFHQVHVQRNVVAP